jgi:hypothetical protein
MPGTTWNLDTPIKTIPDLDGPDSPGAQAFTGTSGPTASWLNGGNNLLADGSLGTTTNFGVKFITNNLVRGRFANTGEFAIGAAAPTAGNILEVQGSGTQAISLTAGTGTSQWQVGAAGTLNILTSNNNATLVMGSGGAAGVVNTTIGSINGGSLLTLQGGTNGLQLTATGVGGINMTMGTGVSAWQVGAAGTLNILTSNNNATLTMGTGGAAGVVSTTLGSINGASATILQSGSAATSAWNVAAGGTLGLSNNSTDHTTNLGSPTGVSQLLLASGTAATSAWQVGAAGTLSLSANATDHTTVLGSVTGVSPLTLQSGTSASSAWTVGAGGTLSLGANATAHTTVVGSTTSGAITNVQGGVGATGGLNLTSTTFALGVALPTGTAPTQAQLDASSFFIINQTAAIITYAAMLLLPAPSNTAPGKLIWIQNIGTAAALFGDTTQKQGVNIPPGNVPGTTNAASANKGNTAGFLWNGVAWCPLDGGLGIPVEAGATSATTGAATAARVGRFTRYIQGVTGAVTLGLSAVGALIGDVIRITRTDFAQASTVTVQDSAGVTIAVLPVSSRGFVDATYAGANWILSACGAGVLA